MPIPAFILQILLWFVWRQIKRDEGEWCLYEDAKARDERHKEEVRFQSDKLRALIGEQLNLISENTELKARLAIYETDKPDASSIKSLADVMFDEMLIAKTLPKDYEKFIQWLRRIAEAQKGGGT